VRLFGFGGESKEHAERRKASEEAVQAGGIPLDAAERLKQQQALQGTDRHIFTSDFSINELSVVRNAGYQPLAQVMGCSIYQVGWQFATSFNNAARTSGELDILSTAYAEARRLALSRLKQEACLLHASGVVGVRLTIKSYDWAAGMLEYMAIGTAIREEADQSADPEPFLSDLSGEEFWLLRQCGYRPIGIVSGNCSYFCYPRFMPMGWKNQERKDYTGAMYEARELAVGRMEAAARACGAEGVIGADIRVEFERPQSSNLPDAIYHFTATGTAICKAQAPPSSNGLKIMPVVTVNA
jgi:uncharacterized protein YbjQ (UPF0145 family)